MLMLGLGLGMNTLAFMLVQKIHGTPLMRDNDRTTDHQGHAKGLE